MTNEFILLSDLHGNAPALDAVIEREGLDNEYLVLGDIHGLNAYPKEVMDLLNEMKPLVVLAGNHDKAIFHHGEGHVNSTELNSFELDHTQSELSDKDRDMMRQLPFMHVMTRNGSRICLTHSMPWPERASGYERGNAGIRKADVVEIAATVSDDYDWVFHGHTHEQYNLDCTRFGHDVHFVNPGSLGYAGSYTVVSTDSNKVEHKSVGGEYDRDSLKDHVQSVLPEDAPHTEEWLE